MKKRILALLCISTLLFGGCGSKKENNLPASTIDFNGYPIQTEETLTMWKSITAAMSGVVDNEGKTPFAQELEKRTGVHIEYIHPVVGQENTTLGLLISSEDLPDMIATNWRSYTGGPQKQIDEGVIIPLNDLIDEYAPNLKKYLKENPEIDKMVKTEDGTYYCFPAIRGGKRLLVSGGQMIRRDWLKECGLEMPETVEELEEVLRAFKAKGVKYPISMEAYKMIDTFMQNFNTRNGFYLDKKGKVIYGPMTDNFKEGLETFSRWYKEGLIDQNYVSTNATELRTKIVNEEVGVTVQAGGGGLGACMDVWKNEGKKCDMVAFPYTSYKGEKNKITNYESPYPGYGSVAITTSCKNPELAVRFLDYGYSEEGSFFYNFGVEGVAHEMLDGEPVFTELITNNPEGHTMAEAMAMYVRSSAIGPFIQAERYIDLFYRYDQQRESLTAWLDNYDEKVKYNTPPSTMTQEEAEEYENIMFEVESYVRKNSDKFIVGTLSFDDWDKYISDLKSLGIERAIELQQISTDRYKKIK